MLCLTDPAAAGAFRTWRPPKSLISPSSGELSPLPRRVPGDSLSASLSQSYHRRLRLFQVESERSVTLFIPLEPLRPGCVAVGGERRKGGRKKKKNARQDVWKGRGTPPRHSVPSSFQAETAGLAESQKLGCKLLVLP